MCADKSTEDSGEENNGKVIKSTQGNTIINKYITKVGWWTESNCGQWSKKNSSQCQGG